MHYTKTLLISTIMSTGLLLTACTSSSPSLSGGEAYIYNGINFGTNRDADFKQGVRDACRTSKGDYTKNKALFDDNESYRAGWENGRLTCKGA